MRHHTIHPQLEQVFSAPYLSQLQKVTFQKGNYICTQGQDITELTYILSGRVKIVRSLSNGKEHILEMPQQPQLLGDVELMTNQLAGSSVIALEEVQAAADDVLSYLEKIKKHSSKTLFFSIILGVT